MTFMYCVPLQFGFDAYNGAGCKELLKDFMFLSYGPYWFMRTYLLLYLFVPVVNKFLEYADRRMIINVLIALAVINFWFGALTNGDASLSDGKNVTNFAFMYVLGKTFKCYRHIWEKIKVRHLWTLFVLLNVVIACIYFCAHNEIIRKLLMRISFGYNSPVLIIDSSILFLCFGRMHFKSRLVNKLSASTLAVYLITEQIVVRDHLINRIASCLMMIFDSSAGLLVGLIATSLLIMVCCMFVDWLLFPVWNMTNRLWLKLEAIES